MATIFLLIISYLTSGFLVSAATCGYLKANNKWMVMKYGNLEVSEDAVIRVIVQGVVWPLTLIGTAAYFFLGRSAVVTSNLFEKFFRRFVDKS